MDDVDGTLTAGSRCVLVARGRRGPVVAPMAYWSDGANLWLTTSGSSVKVAVMRRRPTVALWVPGTRVRPAVGSGSAAPSASDDGDLPGVVVHGQARIHSLADPVGLLFHGATVATAMGALAVRNAGNVWGFAQDAPRTPARWLPQNRVVVRIQVDDARSVIPPTVRRGIAPALPAVVPADVRRGLAGKRRVVLGVEGPGGLDALPAVWGAGFALDLPAGQAVPIGAPVAATLDAEESGRLSTVVGLAVRGSFDGHRVVAQRSTWWRGFEVATVDVPVAVAGGFVLPD